MPGEYAVVIGAGGLGHIGIQVLSALCAAEIIVVDRAEKSLALASKMVEDRVSPLARAWLTIALRLHGVAMKELAPVIEIPDLQIIALEALAAPEGNYRFFETEKVA